MLMMLKKVFKVFILLVCLIWIWTFPAAATKSVTVKGGDMERHVYLKMPKKELIYLLGAPERIKSNGHSFTYDTFGLSVLLDQSFAVERIYLNNKDFKGVIHEEGGEDVDLGKTYQLESVTIQDQGKSKQLLLGMSKNDLVSAIGAPQKVESGGHWLQYDNLDISFLLDQNYKVQQMYLGENFKGTVKGTTMTAPDIHSIYNAFGKPQETERRTYAPSAQIRSKATIELENKLDQPQMQDPTYPLEYRGNHKLYELYGRDMILKYKYIIDNQGIAFYLDHNKQLYTTVIYPPYPPRKPAEPAAAAAVPFKDMDIICLEIVHFDFDKYNIKSIYIPTLNKWVAYLNQNPDAIVTIEGHTDAKGTDSYNQGLSERRSFAVHNYFLNKGISAERLKMVGFSENQPMAPNQKTDGGDDPDGRALNRRVQFKVSQPVS